MIRMLKCVEALGFLGPVFGPVAGGFIAQSDLVSWRWVEWSTLIFSGIVLGLLTVFQPETYAPVILRWKANHLRNLTGNDHYRSPLERTREPWSVQVTNALWRPCKMLFLEPTIMLWTLYLTFAYAVNFGFLSAYPFLFGDIYGKSQGITGLIFIALGVGFLFATVPITPLTYHWTIQDIAQQREKHPDEPDAKLEPEGRLWFAMLGAPAIPISLLWMAWTAYPSITIWSPILASTLFGYGYIAIYLSTYQYLIDVYEVYAASALTMITLVRYIVSGVMVTVIIPSDRNIGVHWTLSILGVLGLFFTPAPYLFYKYGAWIRSKSRFAM